jgi:2-oxoglutarate dehydrogenase complex dehydrogenase (E1) component-like enzyme
VRIEQLAPFPHRRAGAGVWRDTRNATRVRWCQEEPQNQGAWSFVEPRFNATNESRRLEYVGHAPMAASAIGIHAQHVTMQNALMEQCLGPLPAGTVKTKKAASSE